MTYTQRPAACDRQTDGWQICHKQASNKV